MGVGHIMYHWDKVMNLFFVLTDKKVTHLHGLKRSGKNVFSIIIFQFPRFTFIGITLSRHWLCFFEFQACQMGAFQGCVWAFPS